MSHRYGNSQMMGASKPFGTSGLIKYNFYIEPELLEKLKTLAKRDRRSISSTINVAIEQLIKSEEESP
jgi:predicted DNA-binding protein